MRKKLRYLVFSVLVMLATVSFVACGGKDQPVTPPDPPENETYTLTFSVENAEFGSVSCKNASGTEVASGTKLNKDASLTLTATANTGYSFDGWYIGSVKASDKAEHTFTMPASDLSVVAKFTANVYALEYSSENAEKGIVSSTIASGTNVEYKTSVTVTATAQDGYSFDGWYIGAEKVSGDAAYTFNMPANAISLQAKFTINSYALGYSSENTDKGTVACDIESGTSVQYKQRVTLTATAETGYDFVGWYIGTENVSDEATYAFDMPSHAVSLQARFALQKKNVNFYVDNDIIDTKEVDYGTVAPVNEVEATKTDYDFINWFTDPLLTKVYVGEVITKDTDLYAKFVESTIYYDVRFLDYDGSQIGNTQTVAKGYNASIPADPERTGYEFTGWTFENVPLVDGFTVESHMEILAGYTEIEYDVRFYLEDGVEMIGSPQKVKYGKTASKPQTPTKDEYVFIEWQLNGYEFIFDRPIGESLDLYAKWEKVTKPTVMVTFYDEDGLTVIDVQTVEVGGNATAPQIPVKAGKTFKEWSADFINVTSDINISAVYETATCEVTFAYYSSSEGKDVEKTETVDYGTAATAPTDVEKVGYTFKGWDKAFTEVTEDIKVTAVYEIKTFTATFYIGNEDLGFEEYDDGETDRTADYGNTFHIPKTPEVLGYSFVGWFEDEQCTKEFDFTVSVTEDVDVYGKLEITELTTYTVNFVDHDGTSISEQTVVEHNAATRPADPSRTGYTFTGWDSAFEDVTEDITVTAQYEINKYTVRYYEADGETLIGSEQVNYKTAATMPFEAPTVVGKKFSKWSKDLSSVTKNTDVYAIYVFNAVTVKFMDEDGTTVLVEQSVEYDGHASVPNTPTKAGCIFKAWVVAAGSNETFDFNTKITSETLIYAKWETISGYCSVSFKDYDGNNYDNIQRIVIGFTAEEPSAPVKAGVEFDGWYVEGTDDEFDFNTPITEDVVLVAKAK